MNANNKKIKIAHVHVWDKKNKGDLAIVLAVQELLKQKFPSSRILDFPVETLQIYNKNKIDQINKSDVLVFGGGGLFYHYFLPYNTKLIAAIKVPIVIFGVGYIQEIGAPSLKTKELRSLLALVRRAKLVGVRDFYTRDFLLKNRISAGKLDVIGDPASILSERVSDLPLNKDAVKIGLNLNYSGWLGFGKWREDIIKSYQDLANYFIKKHQAKIYYLKHHPGEDNIYPDLKIPGLIVVDLPPREQKYVYGQLDLVVGMMLHVGVMSFGALTPEINVAYDLRNYSFANFIACPELVVDLEKLKNGELLGRAKKVWSARQRYIKKFNRYRRSIKSEQLSFLNKIENIC